jgi:hypothetical protein
VIWVVFWCVFFFSHSSCLFVRRFFIHTALMPVGVRWIAEIMPTRYAVQGLLFSYLDGENFEAPDGSVVSGLDLLDRGFALSRSLNAWAQVGIVIGWVLLIRGIHCFLLVFNTRKVGATIGGSAKPSGPAAAKPAAVKPSAALEMVVVHPPPAALPAGTH